MNCDKAREAIILLQGQEISDPLRAHLDVCPTCRAEHDGVRDIMTRLRAVPPIAEPPEADFWDRLRDGVRRELGDDYATGAAVVTATGRASDPDMGAQAGRPWATWWTSLAWGWQGAMAASVVVLVMALTGLVLTARDTGTVAPLDLVALEFVEAGLDMDLELDPETSDYAFLMLGDDAYAGSPYYEMHALDDGELESFYDELGNKLETL